MTKELTALWTFFLTRFRVTLLFTCLLFFLGIYGYQQMPQESAPDVEIPIVLVVTSWPGSTAYDVETLITEKIEQEIRNVKNLKKYTSNSTPNISNVVVEFNIGSDMKENTDEVKEAVEKVKSKLPDTIVQDPLVIQANISNTPILTLAFSGDYAPSQLKSFAQIVEQDIENIEGVRDASISGIPEEAYHFYLNPLKLRNAQISVDEIIGKINSTHRNIPLGAISVQGENIDIRMEGKIENVQDFLYLPIAHTKKGTIRIKDIGEIRQEFDEITVDKFISTGKDSQRFIALDVLKAETKTNIPKTVNTIYKRVAELKKQQIIPANVQIDVIFDAAEEIKNSLNDLFYNGLQTLLAISILLLIFLGWREAGLSLFMIPFSLLMGILGLYLIGETFNFLSLFALVLSLGLLVDNAIIMTEGISDGIFAKKLSPLDAAKSALRKFRWPIITGTSTTIFAFIPMLIFISGISGEFIEDIPKTVVLVLISSLIVSLFILPVFGILFFTLFPPKQDQNTRLFDYLKVRYEKYMQKVLSKKRNIYKLILGSLGVMIFSFYLLIGGRIPVEVFPSSDENYFTIGIKTPIGSSLEDTRSFVPLIDKILKPYFQAPASLKNYEISVGEYSKYDPSRRAEDSQAQSQENILGVLVNLLEKENRPIDSQTIAKEIQESFNDQFPNYVEVKVSQRQSGPPGGDQPIKIKITGNDLAHLETLSEDVKKQLKTFNLGSRAKLKNITDNQGDLIPQMQWKFDRKKIDTYNLTPQQLVQTLRASINGIKILEIFEDGETKDVKIRFDFENTRTWESPKSLKILSQIPIKTPSGDYIRIQDIANLKITSAYNNLNHESGKRIISIGAGIEGRATASEFLPQINKMIESLNTLPGEKISIGGDNEETTRIVREMGTSMILAMFFILIILVLQFDSFLKSLVILSLIPLSLTGVFVGFWISQTPISFPAMIGVVALAGIIVNDAIVFIDRINHHHYKENQSQNEAFISAGKSRMQPIILTSLTTIFGLIPLALSDPIWQGLASAIIYGMVLATFLTIILVPCLIIAFQNFCTRIYLMTRIFKKK